MQWKVEITEVVEPATGREPTPIVRMVRWSGAAESKDTAIDAAWYAWDAHYGGASERPAEATIRVTALA